MPNELAHQYLLAKSAIEAREDLRAVRVVTYPKLLERDRRKEITALNHLANPRLEDAIDQRKSVDTVEAFNRLRVIAGG
jgi:hypothetical protein